MGHLSDGARHHEEPVGDWHAPRRPEGAIRGGKHALEGALLASFQGVDVGASFFRVGREEQAGDAERGAAAVLHGQGEGVLSGLRDERECGHGVGGADELWPGVGHRRDLQILEEEMGA